MKKLLSLLILIPTLGFSQDWEVQIFPNETDSTHNVTMYHLSIMQQRPVMVIKDTLRTDFLTEKLFIKPIKPSYWGVRPSSILHTDANGQLLASHIDSLFINWGQIKSAPTFLTSYTETDPLVGTHIKAITTGNIATWNASFSWGNHALAGYLTGITSGQVTTALGFTPYNSTNPNNYISRSGITLTTTGATGVATYNSSTGVINIPNYTYTPVTPTVNNNVVRTLAVTTNSVNSYTISTTQNARVSYSINAAWTVQALLTGSGSAILEYTMNAGNTWITVNQVGKGLNLLTFAGSDDMNLCGEIPANARVRIRATSSNMTVTYVRGQEVLY